MEGRHTSLTNTAPTTSVVFILLHHLPALSWLLVFILEVSAHFRWASTSSVAQKFVLSKECGAEKPIGCCRQVYAWKLVFTFCPLTSILSNSMVSPMMKPVADNSLPSSSSFHHCGLRPLPLWTSIGCEVLRFHHCGRGPSTCSGKALCTPPVAVLASTPQSHDSEMATMPNASSGRRVPVMSSMNDELRCLDHRHRLKLVAHLHPSHFSPVDRLYTLADPPAKVLSALSSQCRSFAGSLTYT